MDTLLTIGASVPGPGHKRQRPFGRLVFLARLLPLFGGLFLFLAARSTVWAQQVSLDNFDMLLAAALPFAVFSASRRWCASIQAADEHYLCWGWALSLFCYVCLHSIHSFEPIEGPIREHFAPGVIRYGLYALLYTAISYAVLIAVRLIATRSLLSRQQALILGAGILLNVAYFCFSVFIVRF